VVGESGSGKTTLGRCLLRLVEADAGTVRFQGEELGGLAPGALRSRRKSFQMVFQDPQESLNPRMRVAGVLAEPLRAHRTVPPGRIPDRVRELLALVGLDPESGDRFPHQFSGGQRQRIGIARALASEPDLLVADEPVSALDLVAQAQVIELLRDLQSRLGLGVLFIAHDLAAVRRLADRVAVMRRGRIGEEAPTERIFSRPEHPYTVDLLRAIPRLRPGTGRRRGGRGEASPGAGGEVGS
jgi:ABC-type oligopeptide transport system ATPase subunit